MNEVVATGDDDRSAGPPRRATDAPRDPSQAEDDPVRRRRPEGSESTGTRRAEVVERLRRDEERFRRLAERATDVIVTIRADPTVRFDYVSPSVEVLTGWRPEDLYADPAPGLALLAVEGAPPPWDPARPTGAGAVVQVATRHRDGSEIWVESRTVAVDDPDDGRRVEGIVRDVTASKQAELALVADMATLALLHDVAVEIERDAELPEVLTAVLAGVCDRTGWAGGRVWAVADHATAADDDSAADEALASAPLETAAAWPADDPLPGSDDLARSALTTGAAAWSDHWEPSGDGDQVGLAVPVVVDGRPWGAIELHALDRVRDPRLAATLTSVAAHVARGVERALADRRRQEQHDAYAAFIARAAHELRGSLAAVSTTAAVLADHHQNLDHETVARLATQLSGGEERLRTLANRLLDLSTIETGAVHLDPATLEVDRLVATCLESARATAPAERTVTGPSPSGHRVVADEIAVLQILDNLVANALLHGGEQVAVTVTAEGDSVDLAVEDDGGGVADHLVDGLFVPFVRGQAARGTGTGLGLPISRGLAQAMGGDLAYRPDPDRPERTRFVLRLPAAR